jgi:hypothetical protein
LDHSSSPFEKQTDHTIHLPAWLCRKHFQEQDRWTADLFTALLRSSGRDDKGEGGALRDSRCWIEGVFHHLEWGKGP